MGNVGRTEAGDVQVMSAGTGITHSEFNLEDTHCRLFQIWILPRTRNIAPRWDQRQFPQANSKGAFTILASGYGDNDALEINADARVLVPKLAAGDSIEYLVEAGHNAYLVVATGKLRIEDLEISAGDGIAIQPGKLYIEATDAAELVMVDSV